jgi:ubiquinone/menaquinone biosynthesis C-methylase UbiE
MEMRAALIDGYNRSAAVYDQTAGMMYLGILRKFLPQVLIGPAPSVLDVGCGTGINLLEAANALGPCQRLHGIDIAPRMIDEARRKAAAAGVSATFEVGDAQHIALDDASFDLVICNSAYHWFPDRSRAVAEMSRVLRPGGQVILICVADPGFQEWARIVDDVRRRLFDEQRPSLPPLPTPAEMMDDLRSAGLTLDRLEYEVWPTAVADYAAFLRTMAVNAPTWIAGLPPGKERELLTAVTAALSSRAPDPFVVTAAGLGSVSRKPVS